MSVPHTPQTTKLQPWEDWTAFEESRPTGNLLDPLCFHCNFNHIPEKQFMCKKCAEYYEHQAMLAEAAEVEDMDDDAHEIEEELAFYNILEDRRLHAIEESGSWRS